MVKQSSVLLVVLFSILTIAVNGQSIWSKSNINQFRNASEEDRMVLPEHYLAYTLDFEAIKEQLKNAPKEELKKEGIEGLLVNLPMPDGSFETFEVYDSPVFAPGLAAKYPTIKSYKGVSTKNSARNVRFDTGPYGFHAAIHGIKDIFYIDPYSKVSTTEYITYNVKDHMSQMDIPGPLCGVHDEISNSKPQSFGKKRSANPIDLSVYRLAIACTGEWGAIRGTVEKALADMNTSVNRINQIYENELAMRLVLIDDNDLLLNFDSQTDPYLQVGSGGAMLSVNTNILNIRVGSGSYDLGHVYHTSCDVGGIASLGSMCRLSNKGAGVTCHYSSNLNFMAASVTSHEFGHQMSANHTFNNCNGNEASSNAFEPGSGSTIMSYGGLCGGALNVVGGGQGDDYHHVASLIEIYEHTRGEGLAGDNCAEKIPTSNIEPTVTIVPEDGLTIPENTYFYLEGIGEDENEEDQLTYCWEQMNLGPSSPLGAPVGNAPHYRSLPPNPSPIRYFPSADNIINGNFDRTEVPFRGNRTVDFMLTVRDNNAEAGTAVWAPIQFFVKETEDKFGITSQDGAETYSVGEEVEITWNVAETDVAPINTEFVDILLFTGNANTFDINNMTVLAKEVFNNGSAKVIMPNEITSQGRIIVKASNSIYFSINQTNISIAENEDAALILNAAPIAQIDCHPTSFTYNLDSDNLQNVEGNITYTILDGLPEGAEVTFEPQTTAAGESTTLTIDPVNDFMSGNYEVIIGAITEEMDTFSRTVYMYLRSPDHSTVNAISPELNAVGIGISPEFSWEGSQNAETYTFEISESPVFGETNIITTEGLTSETYKPVIFLEKNTVYYWRVTSINYCGEDTNAKIYAFSTESLFCAEIEPAEGVLPINISGSGLPTIEAPVEVNISGNVADINIKRWFGQHGNNKDMRVSLISPEGKEVILVSNKCEQQNFNCGFDDASDENVKCPLNNGKVYKPQQLLEAFNGDELEGTWIFQIADQKAGNGGRLEGLQIEFCSNQVLDNPYIVRNEKLSIGWNSSPVISSGRLEVDDDNNSSEELVYTIVELPSLGELTFDGSPVSTGDQFTQADINEDRLVYTAAAENYETYFSFTVVDGEGGFIGITNFEIEVDELTSTGDIELQNNVNIYPNPAKDILTIDLSGSELNYTSINMIDIQGQTVIQQNLNGNAKTNLDVSTLTPGFYIISVRAEDRIVAKKVIIN